MGKRELPMPAAVVGEAPQPVVKPAILAATAVIPVAKSRVETGTVKLPLNRVKTAPFVPSESVVKPMAFEDPAVVIPRTQISLADAVATAPQVVSVAHCD